MSTISIFSFTNIQETGDALSNGSGLIAGACIGSAGEGGITGQIDLATVLPSGSTLNSLTAQCRGAIFIGGGFIEDISGSGFTPPIDSSSFVTGTTLIPSAGIGIYTVGWRWQDGTPSGGGTEVGVNQYFITADFTPPAPSPPSQLGIDPTMGPVTGGTLVTITGSDFVATPSVTFDGVSATDVTFVMSGSITCVTPAHAAGTVDVIVTNPDAQSCTLPLVFTYVELPANVMAVDQVVVEVIYDAALLDVLLPPLLPGQGGGGIPRGPGECAGVAYGIGVLGSPGAITGTGDPMSTVAIDLKQFFGGATNAPPPLGFLHCYAAGTTTLQDTFTNSSLATANTNPILLDADGNAPNPIFLAPSVYKFDLQDSNGVSLPGFPLDNIAGSVWPGQVSGAATVNPIANADGIGHSLSATLNKASSGTHALFALLQLLAPTIGAGSATLTEAATLYIAGPPLGGTTRYSVHVAQGDLLLTDDASKIGFFGATPVVQQLVPTGSSADDIITALQALGLFKQA